MKIHKLGTQKSPATSDEIQRFQRELKDRMITIKEVTPNYYYIPYYYDSNLGDIYFDKETQTCSVRFYGWSVGIPLVDLELVIAEIRKLEQLLQTKGE